MSIRSVRLDRKVAQYQRKNPSATRGEALLAFQQKRKRPLTARSARSMTSHAKRQAQEAK